MLQAEGLYRGQVRRGGCAHQHDPRRRTVCRPSRRSTTRRRCRVGANCVPKVPRRPDFNTVGCGNLLEAIKYEKRIETAYTHFSAWYLDERGWGDLPDDTPIFWATAVPGSPGARPSARRSTAPVGAGTLRSRAVGRERTAGKHRCSASRRRELAIGAFWRAATRRARPGPTPEIGSELAFDINDVGRVVSRWLDGTGDRAESKAGWWKGTAEYLVAVTVRALAARRRTGVARRAGSHQVRVRLVRLQRNSRGEVGSSRRGRCGSRSDTRRPVAALGGNHRPQTARGYSSSGPPVAGPDRRATSPTFTEYSCVAFINSRCCAWPQASRARADPDQIVNTENIPTAGVRFINAVPDSSGAFGFDLRFVDLVESNTQFYVTFRDAPTQTVERNDGHADHRVQASVQGRAGWLAPLARSS